LGLPKKRLVELGLAALLHDIGKIRVPEEILYKEGSLKEDELAVFRKYPHDSFEILQGLGDKYHNLAECALHLNDRLDGSGFPQGLPGEAINPYARIIGILELYEAMTHNRPQRQKFTHFEASTSGEGIIGLDGFAWFGLEDERAPHVKRYGNQDWGRGYFH